MVGEGRRVGWVEVMNRSMSARSMPEVNKRTSLRVVMMQNRRKAEVVRRRKVCLRCDVPIRSRNRIIELRSSTTMVHVWRS